MNVFSYIFSLGAILFGINKILDQPEIKPIEISNYKYPKSIEEDGTINIPIICTTDIHGYAFPRQMLPEKKFSHTGIQIFYSYLKSLRQEYKNNILWFDGGDKFQGAVESTFDNGAILKKFFNYANVNLNVLGNHEFDHDMKFVVDLLNQLNSSHATTNIYNKNETESPFPNATNYIQYKIFDMGNNISIGVIGYSPEYGIRSKKEFQHLDFRLLNETIFKEAKMLKTEKNVSCVVLLIHGGIACLDDSDKLGLFDHTDYPNHDSCLPKTDNIIMDYLMNQNDDYLIDAVVGGHIHFLGHHFFKKVPVIHSKNNFKQFNLLYLPFKNGKIVRDKIKVEGPIPICDKVNNESLKCDYSDSLGNMYEFKFHGYKIKKEPEIYEDILKNYEEEFNKYQKYVCLNTIEEPLERDNLNESIIGNIENDIVKNYTNANFTYLNNNLYRAIWNKGPIILEDIYNMNAFTTYLRRFEINGSDFKRLMKSVQYLPKSKIIQDISGFRIHINTTIDEICDITLNDNSPIIDNQTYIFGLNDFSFNDFQKKFTWFDPKNVKNYTEEFKSIMDRFLTNLKVIKKSDFYEEDPSKRRFVYVE